MSDIDPATAVLIAQLVLEDIEQIRQAAGSPDSDVEDSTHAFRAYEEELQHTLRSFRDLELARSLDNALELDQPILTVLSAVEDGVRDDHEYAEALDNGLPLPPQSENQRLLEDADFARLAEDKESEPAIVEDEAEEEDSDETVNEVQVVRARALCIICRDNLRPSTSFRGPCEHFYCRNCLEDLARGCLRDESLFPLQCCRQPLPLEGPTGVYALLPIHIRISLRAKIREYSTPARDRLYCCRPACSAFLGSAADRTGDITCPRCATGLCTRCKQTAHPGSACGENVALEQVRALAAERHWQTCPGCGQIIDLHHGCYHMTCRCRTEFCYLCAERWKNCACPQWEEARLIDTAEQRVENEMGARARVVAPEIFQQRVEQRVNRLRYDHDCANGHRWRRRDGRARCEECHFMLPEYLLYCRSCGIGVCVRCARNRL